MADQKFNMHQVLATDHKAAFMPRKKRDLLNLELAPVVFGDLDPNYCGLLFPDTGLEKPDLASFLDMVSEVIKGRVLHHMEEVHARNLERVQLLENIVRYVYSIAPDLVNDGMEVIKGYG